MKRIKLLLGIGLLLGVLFISCKKENPISHSNCKNFNLKFTTESNNYGSDTTCVSYTYNLQDKEFIIKHINTGFNCCPGEIYCDIDIKNDTIFLTESEEKAECDCNCLYDIDINVSEVEKQKYHISIYEPYCKNQEKILFEIDLTQNETGVFCVQRTQYPWGI